MNKNDEDNNIDIVIIIHFAKPIKKTREDRPSFMCIVCNIICLHKYICIGRGWKGGDADNNFTPSEEPPGPKRTGTTARVQSHRPTHSQYYGVMYLSRILYCICKLYQYIYI